MNQQRQTNLVLADGRVFRGIGFGARAIAVGEVVFNTAMTGYQEILTDPSYCNQLVCLTQPHIGVYGINNDDVESHTRAIQVSGLIVRELSELYSNRRAVRSLSACMESQGIVGIADLDTRALTRHVRDRGAVPGAIVPADLDIGKVRERIAAWGSMEGRELASHVTCAHPYVIENGGEAQFSVCAYDFGAKQNIFRLLAARGVRVTVFPAATPAAELIAQNPDGYFLSNGPGDPAACTGPIGHIRDLLGHKPIMGICLGHQLLALAIGARTYKLPFGHHGANHPVQDLTTRRIEITSQNHGFAVDADSLVAAGAQVTHVNLNDRSVEGLDVPARRAFSVQYHPESAPGPHDSLYLFDRFIAMMKQDRAR